MTDPQSIGERFRLHVGADPDAPFLYASDGRLFTRAAFSALAAVFAHRLQEAGARPGDRITAIVEKSPEAFALFLACQYSNFVHHPVNPGYADSEIAYLLEDADPRVIVVDPTRRSAIAALAGDGSAVVLALDASSGGDFEAEGRSASYEAFNSPQKRDLATLLYTSGTTGRPKGAMLTHENVLSSASTLVDAWRIDASDRLLHFLPFFHVHGLFVAASTFLCAGGAIYFETKFDIDRVFALLPKVSVVMGVPTHYGRMLADTRLIEETASHVRLFVSGSAPLDAAASYAFETRVGARILERYGMTETLMLASNPLVGPRRAGTVGPPLPGVEMRLRKRDGGLAAPGEAGIVEVRGANVFQGYRNRPEQTAQAFTEDGWFITGDNGAFEPDGYLRLMGRESDMIITGGYNVYPREVENVLTALEGVTEAAAFGVPHPDFGESVVAAVVLSAPDAEPSQAAQELIAAARADLAGYKTPKRVIVLDALPKNAMGKVDRKALKASYGGIFTNDA